MKFAKLPVLLVVAVCLLERPALSADAGLPHLQDAVDLLAKSVPHWSVHHVDQKPTVTVEGQSGYRVVLRLTWKEPPPGTVPQQQVLAVRNDDPTYITKHADWHFVLVPDGGAKLSGDAKREILWHVPDEKLFRLPVAMGEGHSFVWFSYTSIPMQHFVRDKLKLTGGDDRVQLALRGLSVVDEGMNTRNSVMSLFPQFGDAGFKALDEFIRSSSEHTQAIRALAAFQDSRATARLVELYHSPEREIQRMATYALVHQPYRREAKEAYLDMLRTRLHPEGGLAACLEFGWQDALPVINDVVAKPSTLGLFREAYKASRQLSGKPIDPELFKAASIIQNRSSGRSEPLPTEQAIAEAKQKILQSTDVDGAVFVGITLATFITKGNTAPVNNEGIEILRGLPRAAVEQTLNRLMSGLEESHRTTVLKVLEQL